MKYIEKQIIYLIINYLLKQLHKILFNSLYSFKYFNKFFCIMTISVFDVKNDLDHY